MVNVVTITRSLENNLTAASLTRENFFIPSKWSKYFPDLSDLVQNHGWPGPTRIPQPISWLQFSDKKRKETAVRGSA